jgi:hypothetical protein
LKFSFSLIDHLLLPSPCLKFNVKTSM